MSVPKVFPTEDAALHEAKRLNTVNQDKGCRYFVVASRLVEADRLHPNEDWYSAKLRIAILVESVGLWHWMQPVHLFRASGFETAFRRALDLGYAHEQEYSNEHGQRVRWRFAAVESLDQIRGEDLDGAEVYSEFVAPDTGEQPAFDAIFDPAAHVPTQTL